MKKFALAVFIAALPAGSGLCALREAPKTAEIKKDHEWLEQLVGEWTSDMEAIMQPGEPPPFKPKGAESARAIGDS